MWDFSLNELLWIMFWSRRVHSFSPFLGTSLKKRLKSPSLELDVRMICLKSHHYHLPAVDSTLKPGYARKPSIRFLKSVQIPSAEILPHLPRMGPGAGIVPTQLQWAGLWGWDHFSGNWGCLSDPRSTGPLFCLFLGVQVFSLFSSQAVVSCNPTKTIFPSGRPTDEDIGPPF